MITQKKFLIVNSLIKKNKLLINLFAELQLRGYSFYFFPQEGKKAYLGPRLNNNSRVYLFIFLLPLLYLYYLIWFFYLKRREKIGTAVFLDWNEKIIFTPLAKILGLKIIWLELPDVKYKDKPKVLLALFKFYAGWAEIVTFINFTKIRLKSQAIGSAFAENKIRTILPGIKLNQPRHQETIFSSLAKANQPNFSRKYFTIGAVTELEAVNKIENLFQAAKICLTVIPNLQLIIVGEGEEKKNLSWLAKKMGIDNLVWFVGEQAHLQKWLDSFDVLVASDEEPKLAALEIILKAAAADLPVIGFSQRGFEEIILEEKTGLLVEAGNSEALAQVIIRLYKDKRLGRYLSDKARAQVNKYFQLDRMASEMEEVLK